MTTEDRRASIHVATGCLALALRFLPAWGAVGLGMLLIIHNVAVLPRCLPDLVRGRAGRADAGIVFYPVGIALAILAFLSRPELAAAVWGILAFGDGMASLIGRRVGGGVLPWNQNKSWAGSIAFVVAGAVAGTALFLWVEALPGALPHALHTFGWVVAATLLAAGAESLSIRLDDNLRIVIVATAVFALGSALDAEVWAGSIAGIQARAPWIVAVTAGLGALAWLGGSVDRVGLLVGSLLAAAIGTLAGVAAFLAFAVFFGLGSVATRVGRRAKEQAAISQGRGGRRGASHALANVGVAVGLAVGVAASPRAEWFLLGLIGSLGTAAFDTVSTEIGKARAGTTILPTTWRRVPVGTVGGVSLVGTLAGFGAAGVVAAVALLGNRQPVAGFAVVLISALVGSTAESLAGATHGIRSLLDGHSLNFFNTAVGGGMAFVLARWAGV